MRLYPLFKLAIAQVRRDIETVSYEVDGQRWQSVDVSDKPEMKTREVFNNSFTVPLENHGMDLERYREDIEPNLPWADNHFLERVGGEPLNPGEEWKRWPWGNKADTFRDKGGQFSHTYMERYWPQIDMEVGRHRQGIRYCYGDLLDVANHLVEQPDSRQAFLPVWFPEDTGVVHRERVPCTLGYHFLQRHGYLHMTYYIRSCDFVRHFRDDLYLSVRLLLWMLDELRSIEKIANPQALAGTYFWPRVKPGMFVFHCVSMHCFENDFKKIQS